MTLIRVTIEKRALRAIVKFAAKDDIRYYLQGVLLELGADDMRLCATNGHMLGLLRVPYADGDERPVQTGFEAIIPGDLIKGIKKPGRRDAVGLTVELDPVAGTVCLIDGETRSTAKLIDAKFPAYRSSIPGGRNGKLSGKVAQFNPEYVYAFLEARAEFGNKIPVVTIGHNGDSAALVTIGRDDFVGVLMPIRADASLDVAPAWAIAPAAVEVKP